MVEALACGLCVISTRVGGVPYLVENETTAFYRKMVAELPEEGKALYRRFVEIEEGHGLIVQAEIDALTQTGFWFEFRSTDLED